MWLFLVFATAAFDGFVTSQGVPPLPVIVGVTLPIAVFLALYFVSSRFRALVLAADLGWLTGMQAWRGGNTLMGPRRSGR